VKKLFYTQDLFDSHRIRESGAPAKKSAKVQNRLDSLMRMLTEIYLPEVKGYKPDAELCFRRKGCKA
jgi:hypothetical protein